MVKLTDKKLREDLLLHARVLCASMDLSQDISSDTILFNPEKIKELKLEKRFRNVLKEIPECSFIYLLGKLPDQKIFFLLDVGTRDDIAAFGEIYDDASPELIDLFNKGNSFVEGPLADDWGVWVSALIPLQNSEEGRVMALGMDIDARSWYWKVFTQASFPIGILLLTVVLAFLYLTRLRLKGERSLRLNEKQFHELFDNVLIGLYRTTPEGKILLANPALIQMLRFESFEELASRNLESNGFEIQDSRSTFLQLMERDNEVKGFESVWIRKDGSKLFVRENAHSIRNSEGKILYFEGTVEDITERRKVEEALLAREKENRAMIEANPDLIFRINYKGVITGYHAPKKELLYQPPEVFLEKNITEVLPLDVALLAKEVIEKSRLHRELVVFEYQLPMGDTFLEFEDRVISISDQESYSFVRDITDQKQKSKQLAEMNQQLIELIATKDKFFSIIAHDIKSPFNAIMGFSNLLIDDLEEKGYFELAKYAENINNASERTLNLLANLLDWARSQTGAIEYKPTVINLSEVVTKTIELYQFNASQKSITIENELREYIFVLADKAMLETVLRNLISNAIKYSNSKGEVKIEAEQMGVGTIVSIRDKGIGIPKKHIHKLFSIDGKYSTLGTMNEHGTGLGLILCHEFIKIHGGNIWVESEEGIGTSIYFSLPANL